MNQTVLPVSLLTAALKAQTRHTNPGKMYVLKQPTNESFLHQLFFGKQASGISNNNEQENEWSEPDAYSSYE